MAYSPRFEHLSLESSLQKVLSLECQHVVESHSSVVEHADPDQSSDQGITLEQSLGILLIEFEQFSRSSTDLSGPGMVSFGADWKDSKLTFDKVNWIRQISRLFRSPYSPASYADLVSDVP